MTNDELMKRSVDSLVALLKGSYGYEADPAIPKQVLVDQILKLEDAKIITAGKTTDKACQDYLQICIANGEKPDAMVKCRFTDHDGDVERKFRYAGGMRMPVKKSGKGWAMKPPLWHLISGHTYTLPFKVYEHINSRLVSDAKLVIGPDGEERSQSYMRRRMSAEAIITQEQAEALSPKKKEHANAK